jgi:hypothetical protein
VRCSSSLRGGWNICLGCFRVPSGTPRSCNSTGKDEGSVTAFTSTLAVKLRAPRNAALHTWNRRTREAMLGIPRGTEKGSPDGKRCGWRGEICGDSGRGGSCPDVECRAPAGKPRGARAGQVLLVCPTRSLFRGTTAPDGGAGTCQVLRSCLLFARFAFAAAKAPVTETCLVLRRSNNLRPSKLSSRCR